MNNIEIIDTDVLVVGGGGAGARVALEANEAGAKVTLAVKGDFGITGFRGSGSTGGGRTSMFTYFVPGGKVAPEKEADAVFERIIQAGHGMANRGLSRILVDEALEARAKLEKWGVVLNMMPFAGGKIAKMLVPMPGLADVIRGAGDIRVREHVMVTDLLVRDGACIGAIGVDEHSGELCLFRAAATILATGGAGQLFMHCFHPSCDTGDGHAMAYEAGAELVNLEYMHLNIGMVYPMVSLLPNGNWGLYPRVRNAAGKEFIYDYLPKGVTVEDCLKPKPQHSVFSTRDASKYFEIAFVKETTAGRANEHDALYLDPINPNTVPQWRFQTLSNRGLDWSKQVEINVACQSFNGGLRIDENAQTSVPGLYAVGETAAGPWGADRLGGLMHAFSHVFGVRAGKHAAAVAKSGGGQRATVSMADKTRERVAALQKGKGSLKPNDPLKVLKKTAWENLNAVRSKDGLTQVLRVIESIRKDSIPHLSIENPAELIQTLELENLLKVGEIMASIYLMRTESRGSHYREDFPERDDASWACSIVAKNHAGTLDLSKVKLDNEWKDQSAHRAELAWNLWLKESN